MAFPSPIPGGVDLLGDLFDRRSRQARRLQATQAAMGVPGQLPSARRPAPTPVDDGFNGAGGLAARLAALKDNPEALEGLLNEQAQVREGLNAGMRQAHDRQQDLHIAERLLKITDSRLPKPARQFLVKGLTRELGIDPRSENARDVARLITSLDPDSLEAVRSTITSTSERSQPGGMVHLARGVLTGQVPIDRVITAMTPPETAPMGGGGAMALGGQGIVQAAIEATRRQTTVPPDAEAAPPSNIPQYREATTPPRYREIVPELAVVLGLDPRERVRNIDVISRTHSAIPTDADGQRRMANDIRLARDATIQTMVMATQLANLVRGRPEALTAGVDVPLVGRIGANVPSMVVQFRDFATGLGNVFGGPGAETPPSERAPRNFQGLMDRLEARSRGLTGAEMEASAHTRFLAREAARRLIEQMSPEAREAARRQTVMGRMETAAEFNARIESLMVPLAFAMAAAKGQTGRTLSDRDVELQLRELGRSASPELFEAALRDVVTRTYGTYAQRMLAMTGGTVPLDRIISPENAQLLLGSNLIPPEVRQALEGRRPPQTEQPPTTTQPPPTTQPDTFEWEQAMGGVNPAAPPSEGVTVRRVPVQTIPPNTPPPEAPPPPTTTPPGRRTGTIPSIEEEEAALLARAHEDRAAVLEERRRAARRLELQELSEARASRGEQRDIDRERQDRVRRALDVIARELGKPAPQIGVPSSAVGGDQDVAAFRVAPPPQRQPPRPVDASQFLRRR